MVSINGKGNVNNNLFVRQPQIGETKGTERFDVPVADNKHIGEFGDKLLQQVQPEFVQAARIPKTDAAELDEMFAMAGIKNPKMPTVAQYASISNHVGTAVKNIDEVVTTNNAQQLFESEEFAELNKAFGI